MDVRDVTSMPYDAIVHQAAQIDLRRSVAEPGFDAEVNVVGSVRLLETAANAGERTVARAR